MNIVRLYNQNRKGFWRAILIIASFLIVLKVVDSYVGKKNANNLNTNQNVISEVKEENNKVVSNVSGVSGVTVSKEKLKTTQKILDEFFTYCNKKQLDKAYEMLTDECKELIYPNLKSFQANYYKNIFGGDFKNYSFENWNGNTYKVSIQDDALAMGAVGNKLDKKIDYVTVVGEKLNISSYIGRTKLEKEYSDKEVKFVINYKDTYMENESYNITVTNLTSKVICLGSNKNSKNIYLQDDKNIKYGFFNTEITQNQLIINEKSTKTINLKFFSSFVSTKEIERIVFKNVSLDYRNDKDLVKDIYVLIK